MKPNYSYEKRQRELEKKKKKAEKGLKKAAAPETSAVPEPSDQADNSESFLPENTKPAQ